MQTHIRVPCVTNVENIFQSRQITSAVSIYHVRVKVESVSESGGYISSSSIGERRRGGGGGREEGEEEDEEEEGKLKTYDKCLRKKKYIYIN